MITIPILLGIISLAVFYGCSENTDSDIAMGAQNTLLFEDLSMLKNVSSSPLDNHIYRIELLGQNEELESLIDEVGQQINLDELNIYGVKRFQMNNTDVLMYSIPYNRTENRVIVYKYDQYCQVNIAEYTPKDDGMTEFRLKTTDGKLFYGMKINSDHEAGDFISAGNEQINTFNNNVYETNRRRPEMKESMKKEKQPNEPCCRQMDDWRGCFECTTDFFMGKWYGLVAYVVIGPEFAAAIGISCIGAGPDTFC